MRALVAALVDARVGNPSTSSAGSPRATFPPVISVAAAGAEADSTLWASEIADVPQFEAAQAAVLAVIRRVSAGAVLEPGR